MTDISTLADAVNIRYTKIMKIRSRNVTDAPPTKRGRGRPNDYPEVIMLRVPAGTRNRLAAVTGEGERRSDVLREAIDREIERRRRNPTS